MTERRREYTAEELDALIREAAERETVPDDLRDPEAVYRRLAERAALRDRETVPLAAVRTERRIDRWGWPKKLAGKPVSSASPTAGSYEVIAPYRFSAEDASAAETRAAELRRTPNRIWTLWVHLAGAAGKGRVARFTVGAPPGEKPWSIVCFVGTGEDGIGEFSLTRFDPLRQWKLSPGCTFLLEWLAPGDLQPSDRDVLEMSRAAALAGRDALEAVLAGLPKNTDAG